MKRVTKQERRLRERLADIETSIIQLNNDDLLDFADIFEASQNSALKLFAAAEMSNRKIQL